MERDAKHRTPLGIANAERCSLAAGYYIEDCASHNIDALKNEPDDPDVKALEEEDARKQKFKDQATEWHKVPCMMKFVNLIGAMFTMMYMWAYGWMSSYCFKTFEVTDSIEDDLDGSALNIVVYPFGWISLACVGIAIITYNIFGTWASCAARRAMSQVTHDPNHGGHGSIADLH